MGELVNWKPVFLAALQETPNVSRAARAAGISRQNAYLAKDQDAEFAAQWTEAIETSMDDLEEAAYTRAKLESDTLAIFFLKCRRRDVYGDKVQIEHRAVTPHAIPEDDPRYADDDSAGSVEGDQHPPVEGVSQGDASA